MSDFLVVFGGEQSIHLKTSEPGMLFVSHRNLPIDDDALRRIIYISQLTGFPGVPLCQQGLLLLIGKPYRYLQSWRCTSAGDGFHRKENVAKAPLVHICNCIFI